MDEGGRSATAGVPTAGFAAFDALQTADALAFLETLPGPYVVKTDGLAAGKGVLVTESLERGPRRRRRQAVRARPSATPGAAS